MLELEIFQDKDSASIENVDDLIESFPQFGERAISSAMKSEGHRLRLIMQRILGTEAGEYVDWPMLNPHTGILSRAKKTWIKTYRSVWEGKKGSKKRVSKHKGSITSMRRHPMQKFKGGLRYKYDSDSGTLSVGFVNARAGFRRLINLQSKGYSTPVTLKMRKMAFALGFPLKKETQRLETPARPLVEPVFKAEEENIMKNIEIKFWKNISRYMQEQS